MRLSRPEQIWHFEVEGYLVLPSVLTPDVIGRLKNELASVEMWHTSYSTQQTRSVQQPQWLSQSKNGLPPLWPVPLTLQSAAAKSEQNRTGFRAGA